MPTGRAVVDTEACPETRVPDPSVVAPFMRVTVPVGNIPVLVVADTVVVNVTDWPKLEGLAEDEVLTTVPCAFSNTLTVSLLSLIHI